MLRDGSSIGIEKDDNTYFARLLFAEYFKRVADDDKTMAWYFSVRGNCMLSLNRHMGLSPRSFAALLLAADFVKVTKTGCSLKVTEVVDNWMKRPEYDLGGDRRGCAEHTQSKVLLRNINSADCEEQKKLHLHLIRIGRYEEEGERIVAAQAINDGATPPPFTHRLRTIQRWLSINTRTIISQFFKDERLECVEKWVQAKEEGLDDSLTYSYNLQPLKDPKQPPSLTMTMPLTKSTVAAPKTEFPFFNIPVENIIFSVLHAQMGVGNKILNYLIDEAEQKVEIAPPEMIALRNDIVCAETALAEVVAYKNYWDKDDNGGKLLASLQGKLARRESSLDRPNLANHFAADVIMGWEAEVVVYRHEIKDLLLTQQNNRDAVDTKRATRGFALKQLEDFKKIWKKDSESIYSGVDKILQKYGIERCAYHGGQINGVDVRTLMAHAQDIMSEICVFLCSQLTDDSSIDAENIAKLCKDCEVYLSLWDAAISSVHKENPTEEHLGETQLLIDFAMAKHRALGFSVTPKTHGMEKHVVDQMRRVKGGIKKLIEHWVEHYHQVGHRYDIKWQNQKNELLKAVIRARREYTASHPEVLRRLDDIRKSLRVRKTPDHVVAAAEEKKRMKMERRKKYIDAVKAASSVSEDNFNNPPTAVMDAAQILASLHNH